MPSAVLRDRSLGVGTAMPGNALPNASYSHQDESLEYEYYYEYDEISFEDLTVNKYSIVIGFWCGLTLLICLLFIISSLLFHLGTRSGSRQNSWWRRSSSVKSLHMEVSTLSDQAEGSSGTDADNLITYATCGNNGGGGGGGNTGGGPSELRNPLAVVTYGTTSPPPPPSRAACTGPVVRIDMPDDRGDATATPVLMNQQPPSSSSSSSSPQQQQQQQQAFLFAPCPNGGDARLSQPAADTKGCANLTPPGHRSSLSVTFSGDL
ncbi:uncharacterized protein LOC116952965 isoform X1 [Petromyzon marinus]|uniref:uncharacterized protein LOC116952965 isoform X1 n=2 Tax=Petromyzon marinus TaxID=7757 RepID=UPI003F6ED626